MLMAIQNEFDLCKYVIALISKNFSSTKAPVENVKDIGDVNVIEKLNLNANKGKTIQERKNKDFQASQGEQEELIVTNKYEIKKMEKKEKEELKKKSEEDESEDSLVTPTTKYGIDLEGKDQCGKSVVHYIVTPITYGSYENDKFLDYILKFGFSGDVIDNDGNKPHDYAVQQSSGTMLDVLIENGFAPKDLQVNEGIKTYRKIKDWKKVDYQGDAQAFLDLVKMNVDKETLVP